MKTKPDLSFWKLWNLSFGFFGVQIAYALQSSQVSRIFSTIGADPHDLSYFWILPPLMGLIVQPIVGSASDRTWNRFGRRLPYLIIGAAVAIIVMCFLPNAGSLGLTVSSAIMFGLIMLMLLDTSINMAMQPFKMLVGDMVNEKQKSLAYSIQSFLCNAGSVVGYIAPIILALFLSNTAPDGEVPMTVTVAFYLGAAILLLCVFYTFAKVKEMPPAEYAEYNGAPKETKGKRDNIFVLLAKAPKVFWTVGIVQFFCWAAFLFMWSYSTDGIAGTAFKAPSVQKVSSIIISGQEYKEKYIVKNDNTLILDNGQLTIHGVNIDGEIVSPLTVVVHPNDTIIANGNIMADEGIDRVNIANPDIPVGTVIYLDGEQRTVGKSFAIVPRLHAVTADDQLKTASIIKLNENTGIYEMEQASELPKVDGQEIQAVYTTVLNAKSKPYQDAGNWNGVLLAVQGLIAVAWSLVLPRFRNRKVAYSLSLLIGAIGFISIWFITNKWILLASYGIVGCAWAAILAMPFTILTNALSGGNIGTYLGLFNCTITVPQIIAALLGSALIYPLVPMLSNGAPNSTFMLLISGILLALGALSVWIVKETSGNLSADKAAEIAKDATLDLEENV